MQIKQGRRISTRPFLHKNFLNEKRHSCNFEPSTSDETAATTKILSNVQKILINSKII